MKFLKYVVYSKSRRRSREGAWIEIRNRSTCGIRPYGRSREGAWIEMPLDVKPPFKAAVAPARERGLKWVSYPLVKILYSRSREGAWIEIFSEVKKLWKVQSRSREGAWIEIRILAFY